MTDNSGAKPPTRPGREAEARPLPKRFYQNAVAARTETGFAIHLDGRPARTPSRRPLLLSTLPLAEAIAAEWHAQDKVVNPTGMPLTRLANTAIDGVADHEADVAADIVKYAGSDLLCYRADFPEGLVARQSEFWDPVLAWAASSLGARFQVATGLMPVTQPPEAIERIAEAVARNDAFRLTALHIMTTLMGSALLALAVAESHITAEAAWQAAHIDEDWQISEWGEDAEAASRRAARWQEMRASATLLRLLG